MLPNRASAPVAASAKLRSVVAFSALTATGIAVRFSRHPATFAHAAITALKAGRTAHAVATASNAHAIRACEGLVR